MLALRHGDMVSSMRHKAGQLDKDITDSNPNHDPVPVPDPNTNANPNTNPNPNPNTLAYMASRWLASHSRAFGYVCMYECYMYV